MEITKNDMPKVVQTSPLENRNTLQLKSFGISKVWKNQQEMEVSARQKGLIFEIVHNGYVSRNETMPPVVQEINHLFNAEVIVERGNLYSLNSSFTVDYDVNAYNVLANIGRTDEDNDIAIIYLKKALIINKGKYLSDVESRWIPSIRRKLLLDKISLNYQLVYRFKQLGAKEIAQYYSEIAEKHLNAMDIQLFKTNAPLPTVAKMRFCSQLNYSNSILDTI